MWKDAIAKLLLPLFLAALSVAGAGDSQEIKALENPAGNDLQKITIGEIEDVILLPWGVSLPARIDTGATFSALDARNITVRDNIAEFQLGSEYRNLRLQFPVVGWTHVRNAVGIEKRPIVEIQVCIGPKLLRTFATLSDRSNMPYPFLVGRSILTGSFLVDTSRSRAVRPVCPASSS